MRFGEILRKARKDAPEFSEPPGRYFLEAAYVEVYREKAGSVTAEDVIGRARKMLWEFRTQEKPWADLTPRDFLTAEVLGDLLQP